MEKLSCDRRVKCRTASSSPTSGNSGRRVRRSFAGRSPSAAGATSCGHWSTAPRPGCEYSKITFSVTGMVQTSSLSTSFDASGGAYALQRLVERAAIAIDVGTGLGFGGAHEQRVAELGVIGAEVEPAQDSTAGERLEDRRDRTVELQHRLVKMRTREGEAHGRHARERRGELARARVGGRRGAHEPLRAQ